MLTEKGWEVFDKWSALYEKELENLRKESNDPEYIEGWSIIDNDDYVKNLDDEIELLIYGYTDGVEDHLKEYEELWGDDKYAFGFTARDILNIMTGMGYIKEE